VDIADSASVRGVSGAATRVPHASRMFLCPESSSEVRIALLGSCSLPADAPPCRGKDNHCRSSPAQRDYEDKRPARYDDRWGGYGDWRGTDPYFL
jgi:hypothetical protein